MAARKPRIEYYWSARVSTAVRSAHVLVNWRLVGANSEIMCQSTQGFRDKADARRSVDAVVRVFAEADGWGLDDLNGQLRETGPGRKHA